MSRSCRPSNLNPHIHEQFTDRRESSPLRLLPPVPTLRLHPDVVQQRLGIHRPTRELVTGSAGMVQWSANSEEGEKRKGPGEQREHGTADATTYLFRVDHVLVSLPPFPAVAKVVRRDAQISHHLVLHLADRVDPDVGEKVAKRRLRTVIFPSGVAPVVCRRV